jgi:hypothetical protein
MLERGGEASDVVGMGGENLIEQLPLGRRIAHIPGDPRPAQGDHDVLRRNLHGRRRGSGGGRGGGLGHREEHDERDGREHLRMITRQS